MHPLYLISRHSSPYQFYPKSIYFLKSKNMSFTRHAPQSHAVHVLKSQIVSSALRNTSRSIIERLPAHGASTRITARKPLEQAVGVKEVLARLASLVGHSFVGGDDGVADGALCLALQGRDDVLFEDRETVGYCAVLWMCLLVVSYAGGENWDGDLR